MKFSNVAHEYLNEWYDNNPIYENPHRVIYLWSDENSETYELETPTVLTNTRITITEKVDGDKKYIVITDTKTGEVLKKI